MTGSCTLCGLPVPSTPTTAGDVSGEFCCAGCLSVARAIDTGDGVTQQAVRDRHSTGGRTEIPEGAAETFLAIDGLRCATCASFVALRGEAVAGIHAVDASYATDTARVHYNPTRIDEAEIPEAVSGYGYRARYRDGDDGPGTDTAIHRLVVGGFLAMLVMPWYVFFLYPSYVGIETGILTADMTTPVGLYLPMALIGVLTAGVVGYTGWPILRGAYVSVRTRQPNMDLLLSVAILAAYAYSTLAVVAGSTHLYYDVAIVIVLVVTAGGAYESRLKRAAAGRLTALTAVSVEEATRRGPQGTETVAVTELAAGDEVLVRPGERVPIDGTVREGTADVDASVVTGESLPTTKRPGDPVIGGSVVTDGPLVVAVGEDATSTLERLTALLWSVQSDRPGVQRFADRLATVFVPFVLLVAVGVLVWRVGVGAPADSAVLAGLTVLVAACPCAMGLATPLAIAGGLRDALDRGIVVTNSSLFEAAPAIETVVFDKTGTLTSTEMTVHDVVGDRASLELAAAVEARAAHPAAAAITTHVATDGGLRRVPDRRVTDYERHPGEGVSAVVDGDRVVVGTPGLVERLAGPLPADLTTAVADARDADRLPVVVGTADGPAAVAIVGNATRPDWAETLSALEDHRIVVLTGDAGAGVVADHPAIDEVFVGVPPDGKLATVERFRQAGPTAMVGDGTNDAPALGAADVGIAIAGTARAADAADVVLVDGDLADVPAVFALASRTRRRIRENVAWALGYNAVAIPLAALGVLNPLFAAIAMAASSILVVTNSRRPILD